MILIQSSYHSTIHIRYQRHNTYTYVSKISLTTHVECVGLISHIVLIVKNCPLWKEFPNTENRSQRTRFFSKKLCHCNKNYKKQFIQSFSTTFWLGYQVTNVIFFNWQEFFFVWNARDFFKEYILAWKKQLIRTHLWMHKKCCILCESPTRKGNINFGIFSHALFTTHYTTFQNFRLKADSNNCTLKVFKAF